ncbi:hypothetical protein L7F22_010536 [Adiantum nelumboides]|nr:hypothetical protein [Adiantum nelumboides]
MTYMRSLKPGSGVSTKPVIFGSCRARNQEDGSRGCDYAWTTFKVIVKAEALLDRVAAAWKHLMLNNGNALCKYYFQNLFANQGDSHKKTDLLAHSFHVVVQQYFIIELRGHHVSCGVSSITSGSHACAKLSDYLQAALSSSEKQKTIIYSFWDLFKSKGIPVNVTTRTRVLEQPDKSSLLSPWKEHLYKSIRNSISYNADVRGLQFLLPPELNNFVGNSREHSVWPSQHVWMIFFSQLFSLDRKQQLLAELSFKKDKDVQLPLNVKITQLRKADKLQISKGFPPCTLGKTGVLNKDDKGLLSTQAVYRPEQNSNLVVADIHHVECESIKDCLPSTLQEADVCSKDGGETVQNEEACEPQQGAHIGKLVKLQATMKGFLARKRYQANRSLEQRNLCYCATKIQACWRGWTARKLCFTNSALLEIKKTDPLASAYLQRVSPTYYAISADSMVKNLKIVTLQALVRGVLARKHKRTLLLQREKKTCSLLIKVQALWRGCRTRKWSLLEKLCAEKRRREGAIVKTQALWKGWRIRKWNLLEKLCAEKRLQEAAIMRIQANWKGFRTRKRFHNAMEASRFDEYDDYEYAAVDNIDISVERVWPDDYARVFHDDIKHLSSDSSLQVSHWLQCPESEVGSMVTEKEQCPESEVGAMVTEKEQPHSKSEGIGRGNSHDGSSVLHIDFDKSDDVTDKCKESSADHHSVSSNDSLYKKAFAIQGIMTCAKDGFGLLKGNMTYKDDSSNDEEQNEGLLGVIEQSADETRNSVAEIARDWGFKDERTAVQFLKALENTRRRAESQKFKKQDSQTRLRALMTRCGGHKRLQHREYATRKL